MASFRLVCVETGNEGSEKLERKEREGGFQKTRIYGGSGMPALLLELGFVRDPDGTWYGFSESGRVRVDKNDKRLLRYRTEDFDKSIEGSVQMLLQRLKWRADQGQQTPVDFHIRERFVVPHKDRFEGALAEIKSGEKIGHWIWYMCPTPPWINLGKEGGSDRSRYMALRDPGRYEQTGYEAALAYLRLPTYRNVNLRNNLVAIYRAIALQLQSKSAERLLGRGDAAKLRSSARLFAVVSDRRVEDDSELHGLCLDILSAMGTY